MILHVGKEWFDKCQNCEYLRTVKENGEIFYRACKANECIHCTPKKWEFRRLAVENSQKLANDLVNDLVKEADDDD